MKLVSYRNRGEATFGAVVDGGVAELKARLGGRYADLGAVLAADALAAAEKAAQGAAADVSLDDIDYLLPVPNPPKIFCVGRNYRAYHEVQEDGKAPEYPSIFGRFTSSFTALIELSISVCSAAFSSISITRSTPPAPSTQGTPTKAPPTPYSPSQYAAQGRMRFLSLMIASAICTEPEAGA